MGLGVFEGNGLHDASLPSPPVPDEKTLERAPLDECVIGSGELPGVGVEERTQCYCGGFVRRCRSLRFIPPSGPLAE